MSEERDYSLKTESIIDDEINRLLREGEERANTLLKKHDKELEGIAKFLLEHETIDAEQFVAIIEGKDPLLASPLATDDPTQSTEPPTTTDQVDEVGEVADPEPQAT
jgi:cell division protease FtsH